MEAVLVKWMSIEDANSAGDVHGGTIMKLCDEAAGLAAIRHTRCRVVTAAMDRMTFLLPVRISELLTFKARVNAVWRTSLEVGVRVEAENVRTGEVRHTNTAFLTMVALDDAGKPAPVAPIVPDDPDALRRQNEAQLRRAHRLAEREAIMRARSEEDAAARPA